MNAEHPDSPGPDRYMGLVFEVGESSMQLFTGQRGSMAVGPGVRLAIDVGEATAIECCQGDQQSWISRLVEAE